MDEPEGPSDQVVPVAEPVGRKTSRFSREVVATMISLASAAFGVVAALAWNSAITALFDRYFPNKEGAPHISALFIYAVLVTLIGVIIIVLLGRLAGRINAQPVEFKYPSPPKTGPSS